MDILRLLLDNYRQILWASIFLYSNISLFKNTLLRSSFIRQFKEIQAKKILSLNQALEIAKNQPIPSTKKSQDTTYLIKVEPKNDLKTFALMKQVKSNQLWLLQPSLNKISRSVSQLFNQSFIEKNKKAIKKVSQQKIWIQPKIQAKYKQKGVSHSAQINGLGQILDHQVFNIKWNYYPDKNKSFWTKFCEGFSYYLQFLFFQKSQLANTPHNLALSENQNRRPFIKGPTIGNIFYVFEFIQNRKILIQARIQNGQIFAIANAGSKKSLLQSLNIKIRNVNIEIAFFFAISFYTYRKLSHKIPQIKRKLKAVTQKLKRKGNINQKELRQFRIESAGLCEKRLCIICYSNCRNTIIFNCRHMIMCDECQGVYKDQNCPLCKQLIQQQRILYEN